MKDLKEITPENWEAARQWAAEIAGRLGFELEQDQRIWFFRDGFSLRFGKNRQFKEPGLWFLGEVSFYYGSGPGSPRKPSCLWSLWMYRDERELPESLEELIDGEERWPQDREKLKKAADSFPAFAKAYEEIYQILFPKTQHWELTSAPEEDYLECLNRDEAIIRRLNA